MFISLAKGKEDLKALILKEKKKKKVGILNMGRRFGERLKHQTNLTSSFKEGENQEEEKDPSPAVSDNDTDFDDEQYSSECYGSSEDTWFGFRITRTGIGSGHPAEVQSSNFCKV